MSIFSPWLVSCFLSIFFLRVSAIPTSYANAFMDPRFFLNKAGWNPNSTAAQEAIVSGAVDLALQGPWAVTNKTILSPTNNTHDYLSFAPYWWADCSNVHNKTELTQYEVWTECKYVNRDGQFTPDQHLVNNTGDFSALGDAVMYASIAWAITGDGTHAANVAKWIQTWFVDEATVQTPNLNFAQLIRGVGQMKGAHTGLLDFKGMAKIATGVLTLKLGGAKEYTTDVDNGFQAWIKEYLVWATTNTLAIQEMDSANNHGSFFFNQLASLYLLVGDTDKAKATITDFFNGIYMAQIDANGEQPFEAERTHPIHYRAYNLGAIITNARIGDYLGLNFWNKTTKAGGTIQKAVDWAMVQDPNPSHELGAVQEMWQIVGCASTIFGDPTGKYKQFLSSVEPSEAFFFWDFHATINSSTTPTSTNSGISSKPTNGSHNKNGGAMGLARVSATSLIAGVLATVGFAVASSF